MGINNNDNKIINLNCFRSLNERKKFSVVNFTKKYNMEDHLVAGNFFIAENEETEQNDDYS